MRQILLKLKYMGTAYHGWQVQDNAVTVQEVVQDALMGIFGERPDVTGCSRTDAGVHANMYCCSFMTDSDIDCYRLQGGLNAKLPQDVAVFDVSEVPLNFHPRYSCTAKQYIYKIYNGPARDPFMEGRALYYKPHIDEAVLNEEAKAYIGTHDFTSFCGSKCDQEDLTRTIYDASVTRDGDIVTFSVTGDGFLYNMVRIMVGTLLFINEGKRERGSIPDIIESRDRARAGQTALPCGLYLNQVFYGGETNGEIR